MSIERKDFEIKVNAKGYMIYYKPRKESPTL